MGVCTHHGTFLQETLDSKTVDTSPVHWAQVQVTDTFGLEDDVLVSIRYGTVRLVSAHQNVVEDERRT